MSTPTSGNSDSWLGRDLLSGRPAAILRSSPHEAAEVISKSGSDLARGHLNWLLSESATDLPHADRPKGVPVLFHDRDRDCGVLGWLSLSPRISGGYSENSTLRHCRDVLKHLNQFVGRDSDSLDAHLDLWDETNSLTMDGSSASLSVLLDWIHDVLGLSPEDQFRCPLGQWVATGGWDIENQVFIPVDENVLGAKARAAQEWGYNTLFVIEGQSLPADFPREVQTIYLPPNPAETLMKILEQDAMTARIKRDMSTLGNLLATIKNNWNHDPSRRFKKPPELVNTLHEQAVNDNNPTLRVVTASILSRYAFQAGNVMGYDYLEEVENQLPHARFTDLRTSEYFRYEWIASKAQALIDLGVWGQDNEKHQKWWDQIEKEAKRTQAPDWDVPRHSGLFFANNMISFRYLFMARISENPIQPLNECLNKRLLYQDLWQPILNFQKTRRDTYPERQANYLFELWWSADVAEKAGKLSAHASEHLRSRIESAVEDLHLPSLENPETIKTDFDLVARWTHFFLSEKDMDAEKYEIAIQERARELLAKSAAAIEARSPLRKGLERIYRFGGSHMEQSRSLLEEIRKRDRVQGQEGGMANLLKARTIAILNYQTGNDAVSDELLDWLSPKYGNVQLTDLCHQLLKSKTHWGFIEGCPY